MFWHGNSIIAGVILLSAVIKIDLLLNQLSGSS